MIGLRLYATIFILGMGTGMAAIYLTPDAAVAPERINAEAIKPLAAGSSASVPDAAKSTSTATTTSAPPPLTAGVEPLTVVVPRTPLLRSATSAPPIGTSDLVPDQPAIHHAPTAPQLPQAVTTGVRVIEPTPTAADVPTPAGTPVLDAATAPVFNDENNAPQVAPRRKVRRAKLATSKPDGQAARSSPPGQRRVESLFLNPLGVR